MLVKKTAALQFIVIIPNWYSGLCNFVSCHRIDVEEDSCTGQLCN